MVNNRVKQKRFIFDTNKCTGCGACMLACSIENELALDSSWRHVHTFNEPHYPDIPRFHLSLACNHCVDPPCLKYCPALAYGKDEKTGAVILDQDKCIGCKYCSWACPYDAPQFNPLSGLMEKCTFCEHRLAENMEPACVELCPTTALQFGDYDTEENYEPVPGFTKTEIKPAILLIPLQEKRIAPECSLQPAEETKEIIRQPLPASKIKLRSEWSLILFTLLAAILVGWITAAVIYGNRIDPVLFAGFGAGTLLISLGHLGKKSRAFRAVLNWRHSWLSREIILFPVFLILSTVFSLQIALPAVLKVLILLTGVLLLVSMDRVYQTVSFSPLQFHSAGTLLTGILFFAFFSGIHTFFISILFVKLLFYAGRKFNVTWYRHKPHPFVSIVRIVAGFFLPPFLFFSLSPGVFFLLLLLVAAGEGLDRCEFYLELNIPTPQNQISRDMLNY